jgi:hypothetical protein
MMTYSRDTAAVTEPTGQPIGTWPEEWQLHRMVQLTTKLSRIPAKVNL